MIDDLQAGLDAYRAEERNLKESILRSNIISASDTAPDDFAKRIALSRAVGIPTQALFADPGEVRKYEALQSVDFTGLVNTHPRTADFLLNPDHAGSTRDDIANMTLLERLSTAGNYLGASTEAGLRDLAGAGAKLTQSLIQQAADVPGGILTSLGWSVIGRAAQQAGTPVPKTFGEMLPEGGILEFYANVGLSDAELAEKYKNRPEKLKEVRASDLSRALPRFSLEQTKAAEAAMKGISPEAKRVYGDLEYATTEWDKSAMGSPVRVVGDALRSLPTTLALALTTYLTRGASLRAEGAALAQAGARGLTGDAALAFAKEEGTKAAVRMASQFGAASEGLVGYAQNALQTQEAIESLALSTIEKSDEYQKLISKGYDPYAAKMYLAATAAEKSGVAAGLIDAATNFIGGQLLGKIIGEGGARLPRAFKGGLTEGVTEMIQSPGEQLAQNIATMYYADPTIQISKGLLESTIQGFVVGGLTGSTFAGVLGRAQRDEAATKGAQEGYRQLQELFTAAAASQILPRNADTFKTFFQAIAPTESVLIDAGQLTQVMQAAGLGMALLPSAAAQLQQEAASPAGIEIPLSELVPALVNTPAEKAILQHLRVDPNFPTLAELEKDGLGEKAMAFFQQEAATAAAKDMDNADFATGAKRVHDEIANEFKQEGTYSSGASDNIAKLATSFHVVLASKLGITPDQIRHGWTDANGVQHKGWKLTVGRANQQATVFQVSPAQAMQTNVVMEMPTAPEFAEAVSNTPGAQITENGLLIDVVRFQKPEQEGSRAIRTGVFYLPTGAASAKHYKTGKIGYGGTEKFEGQTLVRRPLFVKGATGGKAPEVAYNTLKGKKAYKALRSDVLNAVLGWGKTEAQKVDSVRQVLEQYGADPTLANEIVRNSRQGNTLPYAVQENIVAHAVREAGYDAIVGYSMGKAGASISEVFDVREQTFPARGMQSEVHGVFYQPGQVGGPTVSEVATPATFTKAGISDLLSKDRWTILTAENPNAQELPPEENAARNEELAKYLDNNGIKYIRVDGMYGRAEKSFVVLGVTEEQALEIGRKFDQQSVLARHGLLYTDGTVERSMGLTIHDTAPADYFTTLPDGTMFTVDIDFDTGKVPFVSQSPEVKAGAVAGTVTGVHFSKQPRTSLSSSAFGTGATAAEAARVAQATDPRIKQRMNFYVSNGQGVFPESGVGGAAHVAQLNNLYDADADALKIFKNNPDANKAESAVLDAGFDGYLSRDVFTRQGAVVLLDYRNVDVTHVGGVEEANTAATVPPKANIPAAKSLALKILSDRTLPFGQMTAGEWKTELTKRDADLAGKVDFDKLNPTMLYRKDDLANTLWQGQWYYSQLQRAIEAAPDKVFSTGAQVKAWLMSNAGKMGVKAMELEATGITDWLDLQGKQKIDKATVVGYLKANGVQIQEVVKGAATPEFIAANREYRQSIKADAPESLQNELKAKAEALRYGQEKFSQYVVPGGENYRELLLTLPDTARDQQKAIYDQILALETPYFKRGEDLPAEVVAQRNELKAQLAELSTKLKQPFRSSHWDEPNVLAHIRFDERIDADGNKVLFVQEIQSDWGQKGKRVGFVTKEDTAAQKAAAEKRAELKRHFDAVDAQHGAARDALTEEARRILNSMGVSQYSDIIVSENHAALTEEYTSRKANDAEYLAAKAKLDELSSKVTDLADEMSRLEQSVSTGDKTPSAPFVTDTKAWVGLALKRMIAYAVDKGFDKVAWANGEQNAQHYDLSKQVDRVEYDAPTPEGKRYVDVVLKNGEHMMGGTYTLDEIEAHLGKEVAQKIADNAGTRDVGEPKGFGRLTGLDLKVGGEGMKAFYDQIVPQVARDVLKKVGGGQVENVEVAKKGREGATVRAEDRARMKKEGALFDQQGFTITPQMRESVQKGLPLFQPGQGTNLGSFNVETLNIEMLANANMSTALHELGHFFLTVYADLATQPDAPASIAADMAALLKMFGVADIATWNTMTLEEQRPFHEQFAESWEQYLFTGKAPSLELQGLFNTFKAWMKQVYLTIKDFVSSHPNAKLDPDFAQIMDRMIASDAEIAEANAARNYQALFRNAAEAGMDDADFAAYTAMTEQQKQDASAALTARSLRDMRWLRASHNRLVKAIQADAKEKRAAMLAEVSKEVAAEPVRKAMKWLKNGEMTNADGEDIQVTAGNKLQIADVEAMFPPGAMVAQPDWKKLGKGKYGMLAEVGLPPNLVAEMFGFTSGDQLVAALLEARPFKEEVETQTDQRMLEKYGDLNSPEAVARAADEAIHNDMRARAVATELSALKAELGAPSILIKAAKEYARQVMELRNSKTLKPWVFAAAEARASKAALTALAKGDREGAANAKRTELLNHAMVKEAYEAEAEIKKIVSRFKKIAAYADSASAVKSRDFGTVQAVRAILSLFDIGAKGEAAVTYVETVRTHDPVAGQLLADLIVDTAQGAQEWQKVKLADLRYLSEAIDAIWQRASREQQYEVQGKLIARQEIVDECYAVLAERGIPARVAGQGYGPTEKEERGFFFESLLSGFRRMESWADKLDGNRVAGPWSKYVIGVINDAQAKYVLAKMDALTQYGTLLDGIRDTLKPREITSDELNYVFGRSRGESAVSEILHAILHTGNESNLRKLLLGRGWATENQDGTLDTTRWDKFVVRMQAEGVLTKAHYDFAQGVWDLMESMKPAAQKAHRTVFGKYFAEITAQEFMTPWGAYKGGYIPALTDTRIVKDAELQKLREEEYDNMSLAFPAPAKGFTESRVKGYNRELLLDLSSLAQHINKVLLFSHMAVPVSDVRKLFADPKIAAAINAREPKAVARMIMPWLNRAAKQATSLSTEEFGDTGKVWRAIRRNSGTALMMGNLSNAIQQSTGLLAASLMMEKPRHLIYAAANGIASHSENVAFVTERSEYMRVRIENEVAAAVDNVQEILLNPSVYDSAQAWTRRHAYFLQSTVDNYLSSIIWTAAYNEVKDRQADISEADAVHYADRIIRLTQGATGPTDIATFEAGNPFLQMFTQFMGWSNMQAQLLGNSWTKNSLRDVGLPQKAQRAFYIVGIGFFAQAIVSELIATVFRGGVDDEDKDGKLIDDWFMQVGFYGPLKFGTGLVPGVGRALLTTINTFNKKPYDDKIAMSPGVSMLESAILTPSDTYKFLVKGGKPSKPIKDFANLIGLATGLPAGAAARPVSYLADVASGHTKPTGVVDFVRGTITGVASPESKKK